MKKFWYFVSSVLLLIPFIIGWTAGYFYRGFKAGFYTGFASLQKSLETDLMQQVQKRVEERKIDQLSQLTQDNPMGQMMPIIIDDADEID